MIKSRSQFLAGLLASLTIFGLTGCAPQEQQAPTPAPASTTSPPTPALPPRPVSLPLTHVRPCDLLSPTQAKQLKADYVSNADNSDGSGCDWDNALGPPDNGWVVRSILKHDASYYLGPDGSRVVQVAGFPAVQTTAGGQNPATHCILMVDVAPGQTMYVLYTNNQGDYPGMTHELACQLADKVATMAVGNLRRLAG